MKLCILTNSRMLISIMTIFFSNTSKKSPRYDDFGPKFKFFFCNMKLCILSNWKVLISNTTIVFFKFWPKSSQIRHFLSQLKVFLFYMKLYIWQTEFSSQKSYLEPSLKFFLFWRNLPNFTYSRVMISNMTIIFRNCCPKIPR